MTDIPKRRNIIIGDVHGCIDELNALLDKVNYRPGFDSLAFLGDIINRGPCSKETFIRFKELNAVSVLGNHERHLLECSRRGYKSRNYLKLEEEYGDLFSELLENIADWPVFIETDDYILVHGGLIPGKGPEQTDSRILTSIRTWDGEGKDLNNPGNPSWYELYKGAKLVVFGHWAALGGVVQQNVIGLDTGCVYGRELTALILPEKKLVNVPALKQYHPVF